MSYEFCRSAINAMRLFEVCLLEFGLLRSTTNWLVKIKRQVGHWLSTWL